MRLRFTSRQLRRHLHTSLPLEFAPFRVVFRRLSQADRRGRRRQSETELPQARVACKTSPARGPSISIRAGAARRRSNFPNWSVGRNGPRQGIKFYSGKATYRKQFDLDAKAAAGVRDGTRLFLDLGGLKHVAEVRLNGKKLGTLWTAPWRVEITAAVRPAGNDLEIDVVNLWVNRVVGDLNLPKEKRITQTHDVFRFGMVRPTTPLLDSGLFGPVTLQAEERAP